jgi:hypothetical protein
MPDVAIVAVPDAIVALTAATLTAVPSAKLGAIPAATKRLAAKAATWSFLNLLPSWREVNKTLEHNFSLPASDDRPGLRRTSP